MKVEKLEMQISENLKKSRTHNKQVIPCESLECKKKLASVSDVTDEKFFICSTQHFCNFNFLPINVFRHVKHGMRYVRVLITALFISSQGAIIKLNK